MYKSWADLVKDVEVNKTVKYNQLILFSGKVGELEFKKRVTTFGRLRVSKIIKADIDNIQGVLEKPLDRINGGSAARLMTFLTQFPDYVERVNELQKYCLRLVSKAGVVQFDFKSLYADTNTETYEEVKRISKDPNLSDQQKVLMMTEKYKLFLDEVKKNFDKNVVEDIKYANRIKLDSLVDIVAPAFIMSGVKEKPLINDTSLYSGMTSKNYYDHAVENRSLQSLKVSGVPKSGYLTRQIEFLMNNFIYKEGSDEKNECILIPRYRSEGRTAPDGSIYPKPSGTPDESDKVEVRSIITRSKQDNYVTSDLISNLYTDFTEGTPLGISFSTSITQAITQKSLSLKHGGHERVIDQQGYLRCPADNCTLEDDKNFIRLRSGRKEYLYPKPSNFVVNAVEVYNKGDVVGTAYHTTSPIYSLNALIALLRAQGGEGIKYYEKDTPIISECYAYESGVIHYEYNDKFDTMTVKIGSREYSYNDKVMYYYPEGSMVNKYQRFCSGICNLSKVQKEVNGSAKELYEYFRMQFYELTSGDYAKKGIVGGGDVREELTEMLFVGLTRLDSKGNAEYLGTRQGVKESGSFFTMLSYGYASEVIRKALKGSVEIKPDVMTTTILGALLNNSLDDDLNYR